MRALALSVLAFLFLVQSVQAADTYTPVDLLPITHHPAELTIIAPDGTAKVYTPAMLETFPTYSLFTTTPWRSDPAIFEGTMLADILAANGLDDVESIRVTAANDFATQLPRELWKTVPIMVATRVNGQAHTIRERGPIQFVIGAHDYATAVIASEAHLVWMASRIEAVR